MSAVDIDIHVPGETERVICWRASELIRAGFEAGDAVELAESSDVDLHCALELVDRGCAPELAAKILL